MKKRLFWLLAGVTLLFLLSGCKVSGRPLPEGMDKDTVLEEGREIGRGSTTACVRTPKRGLHKRILRRLC